MGRHRLFSTFKQLRQFCSRTQFTTVDPVLTQGTFYHRDLIIQRATGSQLHAKPDVDNLVFGAHFADHMLEVEWSRKAGWSPPKISPLHNLMLHPGAKVLHYAVELFEGIKAYRGVDNKIRIFRPELNMQRMNQSAARACLPNFNGEELLKCIVDLVSLDHEWVPYTTTSSLYIRPTFIGTEPTVGISATNSALLYVLLGPVGKYFKVGFQPISLMANPSYVRSFPGGTGWAKLGCNYAPTILIGKVANDMGCQQVLWLFGEDELLTEVGTMNIFVYWINEDGEKELITPPLDDGLILPGITRRSLLDLAYEWNEFKVTEGHFGMGRVRKAIAEGRVLEMFGSGTACVVCPVDRIVYTRGGADIEELFIPTMEHENCLMQRFHDAINDVQYGRVAKPGWTRMLTEDEKGTHQLLPRLVAEAEAV